MSQLSIVRDDKSLQEDYNKLNALVASTKISWRGRHTSKEAPSQIRRLGEFLWLLRKQTLSQTVQVVSKYLFSGMAVAVGVQKI